MHDIKIEKSLLEDVTRAGASLRRQFEDHGIFVVNLMSGPGAGKTTLLEKTLECLHDSPWHPAVIEGDIQGSADVDRLKPWGVPTFQINTHGACHLDPRQIAHAWEHLHDRAVDLLLIENVGNLVCPAEFDLGETERVMLLSVAEGHDKPGKYPLMFRRADLLLLSKQDLLEYTDFDVEEAARVSRALNPDLEILSLSCKDGTGLDAWMKWLTDRVEETRRRFGEA